MSRLYTIFGLSTMSGLDTVYGYSTICGLSKMSGLLTMFGSSTISRLSTMSGSSTMFYVTFSKGPENGTEGPQKVLRNIWMFP